MRLSYCPVRAEVCRGQWSGQGRGEGQLPTGGPSAPNLPCIAHCMKIEQGPLNILSFASWHHAQLCLQGLPLETVWEEGASFLVMVRGWAAP